MVESAGKEEVLLVSLVEYNQQGGTCIYIQVASLA